LKPFHGWEDSEKSGVDTQPRPAEGSGLGGDLCDLLLPPKLWAMVESGELQTHRLLPWHVRTPAGVWTGVELGQKTTPTSMVFLTGKPIRVAM
jgi:hypothetical protein